MGPRIQRKLDLEFRKGSQDSARYWAKIRARSLDSASRQQTEIQAPFPEQAPVRSRDQKHSLQFPLASTFPHFLLRLLIATPDIAVLHADQLLTLPTTPTSHVAEPHVPIYRHVACSTVKF